MGAYLPNPFLSARLQMKSKPLTDQSNSISSEEFVWSSTDSTEVHDLVFQSLLGRLHRAGSRKVLDLGCGNGSLSARIAEQGFDVSGLEHSRSGIAMASKAFPNVAFEQYDISDALPDAHHAAYDAVISVEVIEHLLLPRRLMTAALQALKPGGVFYLTTPYHGYLKNLALALTNKFDDHWHPLRDYGHVKFFSRRTLVQLFEEFKLGDLEVAYVGRIPPFACSIALSGVKK
jgi:2-polyprenyl-3-methyl-5-hydroxy-6-metoxy-1,4-benzoquinol methylase